MWITNKLNCKFQQIVRNIYAKPLRGRCWMFKYWRVYCDGGHPVFKWIPRFHWARYDKVWNMKGFWFNWLGRTVFLIFGEDINGLYQEIERWLHQKREDGK